MSDAEGHQLRHWSKACLKSNNIKLGKKWKIKDFYKFCFIDVCSFIIYGKMTKFFTFYFLEL